MQNDSSKHIRLTACSHEPGTVNYPGVMIAPGQALPRVHIMICCPRATLPRVNFIAPGQVQGHLIITNYLNSFSFYTDCYRELILNTFTYFWCFPELFIGKFIPNINNEHAQDYCCPGQLLRSVHMEKSYLSKAGYPVLYNE